MNRKASLYAVIGGVVGVVLTMAVGLFAPLGAQTEVRDAEFESITCRRIWMIDDDSKLAVGITGGLGGGEIMPAESPCMARKEKPV